MHASISVWFVIWYSLCDCMLCLYLVTIQICEGKVNVNGPIQSKYLLRICETVYAYPLQEKSRCRVDILCEHCTNTKSISMLFWVVSSITSFIWWNKIFNSYLYVQKFLQLQFSKLKQNDHRPDFKNHNYHKYYIIFCNRIHIKPDLCIIAWYCNMTFVDWLKIGG